MSTVDVNSVIVTGENSVIRLNKIDSDAFTTHASFWRILTSPAGPGDVLYLKSEVTEDRWRIYSDNIAMARWLQSTVVGAINAELLDPAIPVADAQFSKSGNGRDFWTERLDAHDEQIALTWYKLGEPFLVHTNRIAYGANQAFREFSGRIRESDLWLTFCRGRERPLRYWGRRVLPVNPARRNASAIASPLAGAELFRPADVSAGRE